MPQTLSMTKKFFQALSIFTFVLLSFTTNAQNKIPLVEHIHDHDHGNDLAFVKNDGQWHEKVLYRAPLGGLNTLFLEETAFTYLFHDEKAVHGLHDNYHPASRKEYIVKSHAYRVQFLNATKSVLQGHDKRPEYYNYFIGKDRSKWASNVGLYNKVVYPQLYPGISLEAYDVDGHFKYDFIVEPGADHRVIQLKYEGADRLEIKKKNLIIHTSVTKISEYEPYAYQEINGKKRQVDCQYELNGDVIQFTFPNGYDRSLPLVIDPTVVAATLTGTIGSTTFGHTASFDNAGNIYVGAASFGVGFPTGTGSFENNFQGGITDIAINKYTQNGSSLVYSTYIGGAGYENPHSLICDNDQQLYIYGTTNSPDYPTTNNGFQRTIGGDSDIVITVLNSTGSSLVGSTFMGGSQNDGNNTWENPTNISPVAINENYGDYYRGEIFLDGQRNIYVASVTSSSQFPVTPNAFDTSFNPTGNSVGPAQDGVVFKLNSDVSVLQWSTFLGGDQTDTANGIRVDNAGNVYVVGGAGAANFPVTSGTVQPNWNGGIREAYVVKLAPDGQSMLRGTFWGGSGNEKGFFLDIDEDNNVHIYGQTTGSMPITPGTYFNNANSRQFLAAFDNNLSDLIYSTVIGTGPNPNGGQWSPTFDFIPVAFMVDKCNNIYFSGYNAVNGLPTTPDAIMQSANKELFYLGVLDPMATGLSYGTYYGQSDHVDGGTSRFDKSGTVYQGVCSCIGSIMNTNFNAWANDQDPNVGCDAGVFKIDFDVATVTALATAIPATSGCAPFDVTLQYTGKDATSFFWDLGNGTTSTAQNPSLTYTEAGTYEVLLVASAPETCNQVDSFFMTINVFDGSSNLLDTTICNTTTSLLVNATTTNATYQWNDGATNSTKNITTSGTYWVEIRLGACSRLDSFIVEFAAPFEIDLGPDFSVCDQGSIPLDASASNIASYLWEDGSTNPVRNITSPGQYSIIAFDVNGCTDTDEVLVEFGSTPFVFLGDDDLFCVGSTQLLDATTPNVNYTWNTGSTEPSIDVTSPGVYWVEISNNGCPYRDSIEVNFTQFNLTFDQSDVDCEGDCNGFSTANVSGSTAPYTYLWDNGNTTNSISDLCPDTYFLTVTDNLNCVYENTIVIGEPEVLAFVADITDVECANDGNGVISISTTGGTGPYSFALNDTIYQTNNIFERLDGGDYEVFVQDANGCISTQVLNIYEPPSVTVDAGPDRTIELGESTRLTGQVFPYFGQHLEWTPNDSLATPFELSTDAQPTSTTLYNLVVTDTTSGCVIIDDVLVRVDKVRDVYIPNAFSPNGDGTNDFFYIFAGRGVRRVIDFKIFDRWGELIYAAQNFQPNTIKNSWNGTFKDQAMNPAVFVYFAEVEFIDNEVILYKGDVTLLK